MYPSGVGGINVFHGWRQPEEPHVSFQDDRIEKSHSDSILRIHGEILIEIGELMFQLKQAEEHTATGG